MAGPARFLRRAVEDGVLECLRGILAFPAGGGGIAVPGGVGAEVAFPRSHLVEAARGELVKAHERVRFKRGAVRVSGRVWCGLLLFFHKETPTLELQV